MRLSKHFFAGAALALLASTGWAAGPNLIINGGFESSAFNGSFATYAAGSNALTGWTIGQDSVDLVKNYWQPAGGSYSLDLSGNNDGTISQSFSTAIGQKYVVSFDMAANPDDMSDPMKYMQVGLSQQGLYTFSAEGHTHQSMGWTMQSFSFVATDVSSTLHFAGLQDSAFGVALDNISVTAVPEPETYAMLLAGLGLMGAITRRRRQATQ